MQSRWFRRCVQHLIISSMLLGCGQVWAQQLSEQHQNSHVLVLMSYHIGHSWEHGIMRGLEEWLTEDQAPQLTVEWMDTKQHPDAAYRAYFSEFFVKKYQNQHFDAVIAVDNNALSFVMGESELFANLPVIFVGVNGEPKDIIKHRPEVTGIVENFDALKTIRTATQLHPQAKKMLIVINDDESGRGVLWTVRRALAQMQQRQERVPKLDYWVGLNTDQLKLRLPQVDHQTIIFVFGTMRTSNDNALLGPEDTVAFVRQHSKAPIYSDVDSTLGHGVVGGYFNDSVANGRMTSVLAKRVLAGESANHIPWVWQTPSKIAFDYQQLQRFGVNLKSLPTGSQILNAPPSVMDPDYRQYLIAFIAIVLVLISLMLVLWLRYRLQHQQERELRYIAMHDELTGLKNLSWLRHYLSHIRPRPSDVVQREKISLMMLDINRFKVINDSWGHSVGDGLICQVGRRLDYLINPKDGLVRFDGDCFAVILRYEEDADISNLISQYERAFSAVFELEGQRMTISAAAGLSCMPIAHLEVDRLLREADTAMYEAKREGLHRVVQFDQALHERLVRQMQIEESLRQALQDGDIRLHYQPIMHSLEQRVVGYEALARWQHHVLGMIPPPEFIRIAIETGLIRKLTLYLLQNACEEFKPLLAFDPTLYVAVNVSVRDLYTPNFAELVADILLQTQLPADRLVLEVTEDMMLGDVKLVQQVLSDFYQMGVRVAIDDFGTGYSSMSYLTSYQVNTIKIDQSFVRRLDRGETSQKIIKAIVSMANDLGLMVVTEGAETQEYAQCAGMYLYPRLFLWATTTNVHACGVLANTPRLNRP
jgi:diguanylate cyclase (GGDEF)-like protein